jgi:hypothetical protein
MTRLYLLQLNCNLIFQVIFREEIPCQGCRIIAKSPNQLNLTLMDCNMLIKHTQFLNMKPKKTLNSASKRITLEFSLQVISISNEILSPVAI